MSAIEAKYMTCKESASLMDALHLLKANGKGILFALNDEDQVSGVLTDGDLRTFLLNGGRLKSTLSQAINREFVFGFENDTPEELFAKLSDRVQIIPLLTADRHYVTYWEFAHAATLPVAFPELSGQEFAYVNEALLSTWISSAGAYIPRFEKSFAKFCGAQHGVAVSNGTVALHLALLALGIGPGDEVIVPDLTFAASINAVLHAGATPVIVDIEPESWCLDPQEFEKAITPRTKAVMPVHLYGQPCDMTAIMKIARQHKLKVVEDCAEAHGATWKGKKVGSFGDVGCFSFFANKVITTGEGGMCLSSSEAIAKKMRVLRDHGMSTKKKYWHDIVGYNYRMTNIQAAIGVAQLERIASILKERDELEERYSQALSSSPLVEMQSRTLPHRRKITWLVSLLVKKVPRKDVMKALQKAGIDSRPFCYPLSAMPLYKKYVFSNTNSRKISKIGLNLPTSFQVTDEDIQRVAKVFQAFERKSSNSKTRTTTSKAT